MGRGAAGSKAQRQDVSVQAWRTARSPVLLEYVCERKLEVGAGPQSSRELF